jgi:tRNA uridine 5-carboxymethylaminomethyl modification enzyme
LLTSRAEYRLLLRHDNADIRLRQYGYDIGLVNERKYEQFTKKLDDINDIKKSLKSFEITPSSDVNDYLLSINSTPLRTKTSLYDLLRRPEMSIRFFNKWLRIDTYSDEVLEQTEIDIKYEGYIRKASKQAEKMLKMEDVKIPLNINYDQIHNLALEAKEKLKNIKPLTIGQASRISGVNPADISILLVYIQSKNSF